MVLPPFLLVFFPYLNYFVFQAPVPDTVTDESLIAPTLGGLVNATEQLEEELDVPNGNFATDISKIYIMAGIYLACSVTAAILIALFVDPLHRFGITDEKKDKEKLTGLQLLVATFRHMVRKEQLLIIPLTFWSGIEQGFFGADFTAVSIAGFLNGFLLYFSFSNAQCAFWELCLPSNRTS